MYAKGKGSTVPSDAQAREKLALYVYEYLLHVGAQKAAQTFLSEIRWEKNITLGEPPGFLHSWWCVFWDLYCAAPERRDTCEHSSEAKAFHDYGKKKEKRIRVSCINFQHLFKLKCKFNPFTYESITRFWLSSLNLPTETKLRIPDCQKEQTEGACPKHLVGHANRLLSPCISTPFSPQPYSSEATTLLFANTLLYLLIVSPEWVKGSFYTPDVFSDFQ
ncbi:single-stranded DNA-binding protein 3 [Nephila pilipes]|uniref:Single-stranded DNA-binding protein 3 n=1 Tax=Nephila pilipes TaxID=299642 RepID=A0A8X6QLL4_NEPPI|nr:single-stranded DNA-binding protein 3 [Nephila pilipes]